MANKNQPKKKQGKDKTISTQIVIQPIARRVNDIGTWRSALRLADMGNRTKLYDLYTDLLIDSYLSDAIEKRIEAVTDADITFVANGKEVDVINDMIDTPEFEYFLRDIMLSRFWGVTVDECHFDNGFTFDSIPRDHIRPDTKEIAIREEDQHGISYAGVDNILQFGLDDDYGLILKAAPYVIYKRGGFGDWAQFVEVFGMPQRIGKYSSMDEQSRRALIQAFESAGSAPYLVIPKETEAQQTTLSNSGNGGLYNDFRNACNEEILITILGQLMTTKDGSSLSQAQVHLAVQEKKHSSDRRYVIRLLNKLFVPLLEKRGYPATGGKFQYRKEAEKLTVEDISKLSDIVTIPQSWVLDRYNIPLPKGNEPIARKQPVQEKIDIKEGTEEKTSIEKIENNDRSWYRRLFDFFVWAPQAGAYHGKIRTKLNDDTLDSRIIREVSDTEGNAYFDPELFYFISKNLIKGVHEGIKTNISLADFAYGMSDEAFLTAMEQNVFHFSAAKTLAELQELNRIFRESKDFNEFHKKASQRIEVFNKTWQETEYQTAVLTSEANSTYQRLIQKTSLFPYWEYHTAGDDKVRPEHALLDGIILPANDPRWDKIFPPNGWKCRCYVVARMKHEVEGIDFAAMRARVDAFFNTSEWKQNAAQGWGVNRAKEAEIFTANQMYIRKFPTQGAKMMDKVTPQDWGIKKSFDALKRTAENPIQPYAGTAEEWWMQNHTSRNDKDVLEVKDYNGRTLLMGKKSFDVHTSDEYRNRLFRTEYLGSIRQVASDPDEVWLSRDKKDSKNGRNALNNYIMIKYYEGVALAVVSKIEKGNLILKSWFEVKDKNIRRGLLLVSK